MIEGEGDSCRNTTLRPGRGEPCVVKTVLADFTESSSSFLQSTDPNIGMEMMVKKSWDPLNLHHVGQSGTLECAGPPRGTRRRLCGNENF